jgi:hypothetical protein
VEAQTGIWEPLAGPQSEAYHCPANITFYGGAAGGGKTDLAVGLCLTKHKKSIIYRREGKELLSIVERMTEILGTRTGYNSQDGIWRLGDRTIEFGSCKDLGDEQKYQGRPHSLKVFDEITHFQEYQFRFLSGWLRSTDESDPQRILCTGNPPTNSDGDWVIKFFGPWLDPKHPNPADPGELRWYAVIDDVEREVDGPEPVRDSRGNESKPRSRTFIPSKVEDNPFLMQTGYRDTLASLPEPLRSQMLYGDFKAGVDDDEFQVLPTSWVEAAMDRWEEATKNNYRPGVMDSMGVDVARGGRDQTIISRRHGGWYQELLTYPGVSTPNGQSVAALVVQERRDSAPVHVDVIGVGGSAYDHLDENGIQTIPVNNSNKTSWRDSFSGELKMHNKRAELYWQFREALDPRSESVIALPPDPELKADLCAPRWTMSSSGVKVESKIELIKRLGRSTDKGDAVLLAFIDTELDDAEDDDINYYINRSEVTGY